MARRVVLRGPDGQALPVGVAGGAEMKGGKGEKDSDMVRCPGCGTPNMVPAKDGATVICSACGKEFQI